MPDISLADKIIGLRQRRCAPLILELDLSEGITDEPPADPLSALLTYRRNRLGDVIDTLRRASADDRVKALVAKVGGRRIGLARIQELRDAIGEFRRSGKATIAWAESYGEFSPGNLPYYLSTAFEHVYLQPSGDLGLTGVAMETTFLRGAFDKVGVDYELAKRHEYKNAVNVLTERGFDAPHKEAQQRLVESVTTQLTEGIADRRGINAADVRTLIDKGPFIGAEAMEAGLVDALGYRDEVYAAARKQAGDDAELQYLGRYQRTGSFARSARKLPNPREPFVALIHASGAIRRGRSGRGPIMASSIGSDTLAAAIRAATADDRVRAIVLRVNSPGGSYVASDTIWREVVRARTAAKPVVVSMGDVAASGGYFIAMAADAIVAQPGTLTGSIGVFGGKPVLSGLLDKTGVTTDAVREGARAQMFSTSRPFSPDEWERVNTWLDRIYADFTGKVAEGRRLTVEQVHEVARGRVWTGADAAANGLVDHLGGLDTAARIARQRAGLPDNAAIRRYPRVSPLERLRGPQSSEDRAAAATRLGTGLLGTGLPGADAPVTGLLGPLAESYGPVVQFAARLGLPAGGPLLLPGSWVIN
ncbi:MAG TPA: signal peptide peptidase SppA [Streptosporangiaceae bacterium]|nr:signal peptide peptidase SppA [Streptosporangiaceae bacterium]